MEMVMLAKIARIIAPLEAPVRIRASFYNGGKGLKDGRYRPLDRANGIAALKAAIDGLREGGVILDDTNEMLWWGSVDILNTQAQHENRCGVMIELRGQWPAPPALEWEEK